MGCWRTPMINRLGDGAERGECSGGDGEGVIITVVFLGGGHPRVLGYVFEEYVCREDIEEG